MTTGHPASASRARWTRERLIGLGLGADQIVLSECTLPSLRNEGDLAPAHYRPEFAPLVQRLSRLLGTGRGISLYVTGGRDSTATRVHAALQIAAGLAPLGRQVVLADTEFLRPGLDGLLAEPLAEGILDMVRFGRSSRALLLRPVPEGPWLLPSGSIPADDAAPLDVEALRSVAYRISQVCDLALYVGPLPARDDLHPMARVCDHVLLASDESMVAPSEIVDALAGLQAQHVHVLGAVLVAPAVDVASVPAMSAPPLPPVVPPLEALRPSPPMETPPIPSLAPEPKPLPFDLRTPATSWGEGGLDTPAGAWPPISPRPPDSPATPVVPPATPSPPPVPPEMLPEQAPLPRAAELEPDIRLPPLEELRPDPVPAWSDFEGSAVESEPGSWDTEAASEAAAAKLPASEPGQRETSQSRGSRRSYDLPDAEFAFDEEAKFSRWPLVVVIVLLVTIVFFVGSIFWLRSRPGGLPEKRAEAPLAGATPDSPSSDAAGPDDSRAAQESGANPPAATQAHPAQPTGPAPVVTPPNRPDDRAASTEPNASRGPTPSGPAEQRDESSGPPASSSTPPSAASAPPPAPAPSPSPSQPPVAVGEIQYAVHVSSYQTVNKANVEIANLRKLGYEGRAVREHLGEKGWWYRVYAGSFATREEATAARELLLKHPDYNYAQVRRLPRP